MKNLLILSIFFVFAVLLMGCHKNNDDDECDPGKVRIIGTCYDESTPYYFFSGYPDFYCYNDSVAVGFPINQGDNDVIYVHSYRFLTDQGIGNNYLIGGSRSGDREGNFYEACYESPSNPQRYHTFLVVEDYDKITKDTRELHCRLELRDKQFDVFAPFVVLDSSRVVLRRVN